MHVFHANGTFWFLTCHPMKLRITLWFTLLRWISIHYVPSHSLIWTAWIVVLFGTEKTFHLGVISKAIKYSSSHLLHIMDFFNIRLHSAQMMLSHIRASWETNNVKQCDDNQAGNLSTKLRGQKKWLLGKNELFPDEKSHHLTRPEGIWSYAMNPSYGKKNFLEWFKKFFNFTVIVKLYVFDLYGKRNVVIYKRPLIGVKG